MGKEKDQEAIEERKLIKFSNYSLCITLPKWLVTKLEWNKGDEICVEVDEENAKLVISKSPEQTTTPKNLDSTLRW